MSIELDRIKQIAHLVRLDFKEEELSQFANKFNKILEMVEQISQIDTTDVLPLSNPLEQIQSLREDEVSELNVREKMQKLAPQTESGLYLVPKVIE